MLVGAEDRIRPPNHGGFEGDRDHPQGFRGNGAAKVGVDVNDLLRGLYYEPAPADGPDGHLALFHPETLNFIDQKVAPTGHFNHNKTLLLAEVV